MLAAGTTRRWSFWGCWYLYDESCCEPIKEISTRSRSVLGGGRELVDGACWSVAHGQVTQVAGQFVIPAPITIAPTNS